MNITHDFVNVDFIIERLHLNYEFKDINKSEVAERIWDLMGLIWNPDIFTDEYTSINIVDFKGTIPSDFYGVSAIVEADSNIPLTESTDLLNRFTSNLNPDDVDTDEYTYKIYNGVIYCGIRETSLIIQYKKIPVDSNNLPLVPKDPKSIRAVVDHIAERLAFKLWIKDIISEKVYRKIEQDALFSIASFRTRALMPSIDSLERIKNRYISLLKSPTYHDKSFKSSGTRTIKYSTSAEYNNPFSYNITYTAASAGQTVFDRGTEISLENLSTVASAGEWVLQTVLSGQEVLTYGSSGNIIYDAASDTIVYSGTTSMAINDYITFSYSF